jgi:flagellar motor switch protein FliN/FliY
LADPVDVLTQLLSPQQAATLDAVGRRAWQAAARALQAIQGAEPSGTIRDARLVMPDEIAGEFGEPHLAVPIELSTDNDQSATAYLVLPTAPAAAYLQTEADNPEDQEQQTLVVASTFLGQVLQALNQEVFSKSSNGLILSFDDVTANTMAGTLAGLDDACLYLTAAITLARELPLAFVLPGTFLDIVAGSMAGAFDQPAPAPADTADTPLITQEDLEAAELLDVELNRFDQPQPAASRPAAGPAPRSAPAAGPPPKQEPQVTAQRARFAPLPEPGHIDYSSGIELLAGLEMNVTVELGRTRLTVAEVLGLGPGSVIELDRIAGEPVDILVNDRLVARGEVVVVDENFGVRVVEVVRRGQDHEIEEPEAVG